MEPSDDYLIWSIEHRGWWLKSRHGYNSATHKAGRFSFDEATEICNHANKYSETIEEIMVPAPSLHQVEMDKAESIGERVTAELRRLQK
jgi:hypothetical protein